MDKPSSSIPVEVLGEDKLLDHPAHSRQATHDTIRKQEHNTTTRLEDSSGGLGTALTVLAEHSLHNVAGPERIAVGLPVIDRDLEDEENNSEPEQGIEAMEWAVH